MDTINKPLIVAKALTKVYNGKVTALSDVSFSLEANSIVCIAGPNGAGKTTLLRLLGTQLGLTSGQLTIDNTDVDKNPKAIRYKLASVPQEALPDPLLTIWEHVYYYLRMRGHHIKDARKRAKDALIATGLLEKKGKIVGSLSGGQKRRVLIAMALGTDASIFFLDEPTGGLDPVARNVLWNELRKLKRRALIVLTTHSMEEVSAIADRIIIIKDGKIILDDKPSALKRSLPNQEKIVIIGQTAKDFEKFGVVEQRQQDVILYPHDKVLREKAINSCLRNGIGVSISPATLDDVYLTAIANDQAKKKEAKNV